MSRRTVRTVRRNVLIFLIFLGFAGVYSFGRGGTSLQELSGSFRAVDGDTLTLDGLRIRIKGIDAPERRQLCGPDGRRWPCGLEAGRALAARAGNLRCVLKGLDKYQRRLAVCRTASGDLGAELVRLGHAVGYGAYGREEAEARLARRGLWTGPFERPEDWRKAHRPKGASMDAPAPLDFLRSWWYGKEAGGERDDEAL